MAPDNRRSTARHNSSIIEKLVLFPAFQATGCQFSQWRAVGVAAQKRLICRLFFHSAPFRLVARCHGPFIPPYTTIFGWRPENA
jgi:hypothetical protein